ncbi:MAG: Fe-S cluster protein [Chloroflexi bacterium]|nr:Fe-S cluster protein [Chloroflexota bacterium]
MSDAEKLLQGFFITQVLDCLADPSKNRVIAELSDDISAVFPYLNAAMRGVIYNPGARTLTLRRGERILTFYPRVAVMAKVDGESDAAEQLRWFQELCNATWQRREEITPSYERRKLLGPLDVYLLLPRLNCRACGELTCMAFAFRLLWDERSLDECPPLHKPPFDEGGRRLAELTGSAAPSEAHP